DQLGRPRTTFPAPQAVLPVRPTDAGPPAIGAAARSDMMPVVRRLRRALGMWLWVAMVAACHGASRGAAGDGGSGGAGSGGKSGRAGEGGAGGGGGGVDAARPADATAGSMDSAPAPRDATALESRPTDGGGSTVPDAGGPVASIHYIGRFDT